MIYIKRYLDMDLILSWVFFGVVIGVVADFLGVSPRSQNFLISLILGVLGAAAGGSIGLLDPIYALYESTRISPLLFMLLGSFLLVVLPKTFTKKESEEFLDRK